MNTLKEGTISLIREFVEAASNPIINNPLKWKTDLRDILNTKINRAGTREGYILALECNILFFNNILNDSVVLINKWLKSSKQLPSEPQFASIWDNMREMHTFDNAGGKIYNNGKPLSVKDKKIIEKIDSIYPITTRIDNLEFEYMYLYTQFEIIFGLMLLFTRNQHLVQKFNSADSMEVVKELLNYTDFFINYSLGNMKFSTNI